MRKLALTLAGTAFMAVGAWAKPELGIKFPATAATDTGTVKKLSGVSSYQSAGSKITVTLPGDQTLKFNWDIAPAAGDDDYAATGGALIPITPDWQIYDLSEADSVYFDVKGAAATNINFILSSKSLPKAMLDANASVQLMSLYSDPGVEVTTSWQTIGLATEDFKVSFFCNEDKPECEAASAGVNWTTAGKEVEALNIQPILGWKNATTINKNAVGTIFLRNFRLTNVSKYPKPAGKGCVGTKSFQLDNFAGKTPGQTRQGGYWFAFTDTSTTKPTAPATGASTLTLPEGAKAWKVTTGVGALLTTTLEKNVGTTFHEYAGWASVGFSIPSAADSDGVKHGIDLENLKAISFDFTTGANIDPTLKFDDMLVPAVTFKVAKTGIDDSATHFAAIPASAGDGSSICVDLADLKQPFYVKGDDLVDFIPSGINQMVWELKIEDQKDPSIHTSGPNSLLITNVKLWGVDSAEVPFAEPGQVGVKSGIARSGFRALYGNGLTVSYKVSGPAASVSVVGLDGSVVASFKTAAVANNLNLPVSLTRGTYMVVVRGDKAGALVRRIAVSR